METQKQNLNLLNVAQICSIKSYLNRACNFYTYKQEVKFFGIVLQKAGFYWNFIGKGTPHTKEELESERYICKGEVVFYKPYLEIRMSDGSIKERYFNSEERLFEYMEQPEIKAITFLAQ